MNSLHSRYTGIMCNLLILSIFVFAFSGCKSENNINQDEMNQDLYVRPANMFSVNELKIPEELFIDRCFYSQTNECLFVYGYLEKVGDVLISYDYNGEMKEIIKIPLINDITEMYFINTIGILSDGNFVIAVTVQSTGYEGRLCLVSPDGETINQEEYTYEFDSDIYISNDECIYVTYGTNLKIYDNKLNEITAAETDVTLTKIEEDAIGNIVIYSPYDEQYYTLDSSREKIIKYNVFENQRNMYKQSKIYFQDSYDVYISDKTGIYAHSINYSKAELILDWANSSLIYDNVKIWAILDKNTVFASVTDTFTTGYIPVILKKIPDSEVKAKVQLTLAMTEYEDSHLIAEAVALFNRENDNYHIAINDYTEYITNAAAGSQAIEAFNMDIINGKIPDIVFLNYEMIKDIDTYTTKNFFTDMSEYISKSPDKLLESVKSSYSDNGKIYHIPVKIELTTLLVKDSVIAQNHSLTLEKLYSAADNLVNDSSLFSVYPEILNTAVFDFVDFENTTCNFESESFIRLLEFVKNMGDFVDNKKGAIKYFSSRYYFTSDNIMKSLHNDDFYFLQLPMKTIDSYAIAKLCFGDDDFTLCGYPTSSGNGSMIGCDFTLGIPEKSQSKQGAWEFIEFLLSEKIQNSDVLVSSGLPVTLRGIESLLEYSEYYISLYSSDNKNIGDTRLSVVKTKTPYPETNPHKKEAQYCITLTDSDKQNLMKFFNETEIKSVSDKTITSIVNEEYSAYENDAVSAEDTAKLIQKRVYIYINENS